MVKKFYMITENPLPTLAKFRRYLFYLDTIAHKLCSLGKMGRRGLTFCASSLHDILRKIHTYRVIVLSSFGVSPNYRFPILYAIPLDQGFVSSFCGRFWHLMPVLVCLYLTFFGMGGSLFCAPFSNIGHTSSPI